MCIPIVVPVGLSNAPIATAILSSCNGAQKSVDPHEAQKPRLAFSDDWNHASECSSAMVNADVGTSVEAKQCPDCLRHCEQWQTAGGGRSPATVKVMAPQRHDPACIHCSFRRARSRAAGLFDLSAPPGEPDGSPAATRVLRNVVDHI